MQNPPIHLQPEEGIGMNWLPYQFSFEHLQTGGINTEQPTDKGMGILFG
jgi:hypothetical protein